MLCDAMRSAGKIVKIADVATVPGGRRTAAEFAHKFVRAPAIWCNVLQEKQQFESPDGRY